MTYPTMPRPAQPGDAHRAAIDVLERALKDNDFRAREEQETLHAAESRVAKSQERLTELEEQREGLQRGLDALKAADQ